MFPTSPSSHEGDLVEAPSSGYDWVIRDKRLAFEALKQRVSQQNCAAPDDHNATKSPEAPAPLPLDETQYLALPHWQHGPNVKRTRPELGVELCHRKRLSARDQLEQVSQDRIAFTPLRTRMN